MNDISEALYRAAIGPTPSDSGWWMWSWVGWQTAAHKALRDHIDLHNGESQFNHKSTTEDERRMFLLFVAEAIK